MPALRAQTPRNKKRPGNRKQRQRQKIQNAIQKTPKQDRRLTSPHPHGQPRPHNISANNRRQHQHAKQPGKITMRRLQNTQTRSSPVHHQSPLQRTNNMASQISKSNQKPQSQRHKPQRSPNLPHRQKIKQQSQNKDRPNNAKDDASSPTFPRNIFRSGIHRK